MIWVRLKDHPTKQVLIKEKDYDESKHIMPTEEEKEQEKLIHSFNIKQICESQSAPGMFMKTDNSRGSVTHNGKLDSGAVEDLIDRGLEGVKKRALERKKKYGAGFKKIKNRRIVPKRKGRK